jgi:hypothetical protein
LTMGMDGRYSLELKGTKIKDLARMALSATTLIFSGRCGSPWTYIPKIYLSKYNIVLIPFSLDVLLPMCPDDSARTLPWPVDAVVSWTSLDFARLPLACLLLARLPSFRSP